MFVSSDIEDAVELVHLRCPLAVRRFAWRDTQDGSSQQSALNIYSRKCHNLLVCAVADELLRAGNVGSVEDPLAGRVPSVVRCCRHKTALVRALRDICTGDTTNTASTYLLFSRECVCSCEDKASNVCVDILHVQRCSDEWAPRAGTSGNAAAFLITPVVVSEYGEEEHLGRNGTALRAGAQIFNDVLVLVRRMATCSIDVSVQSELWFPAAPFEDVARWLFAKTDERRCSIPWLKTSTERNKLVETHDFQSTDSAERDILTLERTVLTFRGAGNRWYDLARVAYEEMVAEARAECVAHIALAQENRAAPDDKDSEEIQKSTRISHSDVSFPESMLDAVSANWFFRSCCTQCPFLFDCKQSALRDEAPQCVGAINAYEWSFLKHAHEEGQRSVAAAPISKDQTSSSISVAQGTGTGAEKKPPLLQEVLEHSFRTSGIRERRIIARNMPILLRTGRIPSTTMPIISLVITPPHVSSAGIEGVSATVPRVVLAYTTPRGMREFLFDDDAVKVALSSAALSAAVVVWDEQQKRAAQIELLEYARSTNQLHKLTGVFETPYNSSFAPLGGISSDPAQNNASSATESQPPDFPIALHPLVDRIFALAPAAAQCLSLTTPQPYTAPEVLSRARQVNMDSLVGNSGVFADFILEGVRKRKGVHESNDENDIPERLMTIAKVLIERMELIRNAQNEHEPVVRHKPLPTSMSKYYYPSYLSTNENDNSLQTQVVMLSEFLGRLIYISLCRTLLHDSHAQSYRCAIPSSCNTRSKTSLGPRDSLWLTAVDIPFLHDPLDASAIDNISANFRGGIVDLRNESVFPDVAVKDLFDSNVIVEEDDVVKFDWVLDEREEMPLAVVLQLHSKDESRPRATKTIRMAMTKNWYDGGRWAFQPKSDVAHPTVAGAPVLGLQPSPEDGMPTMTMVIVGVRVGSATIENEGKVRSQIYAVDISQRSNRRSTTDDTGPESPQASTKADGIAKEIDNFSHMMVRSAPSQQWKHLQLMYLCYIHGRGKPHNVAEEEKKVQRTPLILRVLAEQAPSDRSLLTAGSKRDASGTEAPKMDRIKCETLLHSGCCCAAVKHLASAIIKRFQKCTAEQTVAITAPFLDRLHHFQSALEHELEVLLSGLNESHSFTYDICICSSEKDVLVGSEGKQATLTEQRDPNTTVRHHRIIIGLAEHLCCSSVAYQNKTESLVLPDWSAVQMQLPLAHACDVLIMLYCNQFSVAEGILCEHLLKSEGSGLISQHDGNIQLFIVGDQQAEQIDTSADLKDLVLPLSVEETRVWKKNSHATKSLLCAVLSQNSELSRVVHLSLPSPSLSSADDQSAVTKPRNSLKTDSSLLSLSSRENQAEVKVVEVANPAEEFTEIHRICINSSSRTLVVCHSDERCSELLAELRANGLPPHLRERVKIGECKSSCIHLTTMTHVMNLHSDDCSRSSTGDCCIERDVELPITWRYDTVIVSLANEGCFHDPEILRLSRLKAAFSLCGSEFLLLVCAYERVRDTCAFSISWTDADSQDGAAYVYQVCKATSPSQSLGSRPM